MHRRTLDIIFGVGGLVLAILLAVMGGVLRNQADFAKDYVHDQLAAQKIVFTPKAVLQQAESAQCLKDDVGQPLVTGKRAECYANNDIAVHLGEVNDGKTQTLFRGETCAVCSSPRTGSPSSANGPSRRPG